MSARHHAITELSTARLADIARTYGLGELRDGRLCSAGLINSNYQLTTSKGSYLVRIYAPPRKRENIEFELSVLRYLSAHDFPCQRPIEDLDGENIGSLNERLYAVLTFLPGATIALEELSASICQQFGALYAKLQRLLRDFVPEGIKPDADYVLVQELVSSIRSIFRDKGVAEADRARIEASWNGVWPLFRETERSVVHGDLYYQNVLCEHGNVTGIIDFDDAFLGSPLLDLALTMMEFSTWPENELDFELMAALLTSYHEHDPPLQVTPERLWNATRFQCIKFLGYTIDLTVKAGDKPTENDYYKRLLHLEQAKVQARFVDTVRRSLGHAA